MEGPLKTLYGEGGWPGQLQQQWQRQQRHNDRALQRWQRSSSSATAVPSAASNGGDSGAGGCSRGSGSGGSCAGSSTGRGWSRRWPGCRPPHHPALTRIATLMTLQRGGGSWAAAAGGRGVDPPAAAGRRLGPPPQVASHVSWLKCTAPSSSNLAGPFFPRGIPCRWLQACYQFEGLQWPPVQSTSATLYPPDPSCPQQLYHPPRHQARKLAAAG